MHHISEVELSLFDKRIISISVLATCVFVFLLSVIDALGSLSLDLDDFSVDFDRTEITFKAHKDDG